MGTPQGSADRGALGETWERIPRLIPYEALPSQQRFHDSEARFKAFCGPVGSGKSQALCQEAIALTYQNQRCTGLLGAPTFPMLRDALQVQFFEACRAAEVGYEWLRAENRVLLESGSVVLFRALDNYERLRGPNLAWFGIDELTYTRPEAWLRLEARLRDPRASRLCGFAAFTPRGFDWAYEKFRSHPVAGYELIEAAPLENHYILAQVPDYYERLRCSYDARFYEQEALGKFVNVQQGQIYYAFERNVHVRTIEYDPRLPLRWAWDFNVTPMSSVICQQRGGEVSVLDEVVLATSSTPEVCREFMARWGAHRGELMVYGDAAGSSAHSATGKSDYHMIREFFRTRPAPRFSIRVPRSNPPVRDRINVLNARLRNAAGECSLFLDPRCRELIADLEQVCYKPHSTVIDKADPARTHTSDALGYYLWYEFRPSAAVGEKPGRLF
jgi:hypothetical protein